MIKLAALFALALTISYPHFAVADQQLGVSSLNIGGPRSLTLTIWYPANGGQQEAVGGNAVFEGAMAGRDASYTMGSIPLILVSHGGLRSAADSGAWLASALAQAGNIVVEVNSPRPISAAIAVDEIWRRPDDITRALGFLLSNPDWVQRIDQRRISVVGFALGGTASYMLGGALIEPTSFVQSCSGKNEGPDCNWYAAQGVSLASVDQENLARSRHDQRIRSVIAIAPEYFNLLKQGRFALDAPALNLMLEDIPETAPETNHSFLQVAVRASSIYDGFPICTPAGPTIIASDGGEPLLCGNSPESRQGVHDAIVFEILSFLHQTHQQR